MKHLKAISQHIQKELTALGHKHIRARHMISHHQNHHRRIYITINSGNGGEEFKINLHDKAAILFIQKPVRQITTRTGEYPYTDPQFPTNLLQDLPKPHPDPPTPQPTQSPEKH